MAEIADLALKEAEESVDSPRKVGQTPKTDKVIKPEDVFIYINNSIN